MGLSPCCAPCRCHYTGRLASNNAVFDSSYERGKPLSFKVGCQPGLPVPCGTCKRARHQWLPVAPPAAIV